MMRRRNHAEGLPMTSQLSVSDGSGRGIQMDAPIVRTVKNSSTYTKGTYAGLVVCLLVMWWAWGDITYHQASTLMKCNSDEGCELEIVRPGRSERLNMKFSREQIVSAETLSVDINGEPLDSLNPPYGRNRHEHSRHHEAETEKISGRYESYAIILQQRGKSHDIHRVEEAMAGHLTEEQIHMMEEYGSAAMTDPELIKHFQKQKHAHHIMTEERKERLNKKWDNESEYLPRLDELVDFADKVEDGQYVLILRKYNIGHTRRSPTSMVHRITQYEKKQRENLTIREFRNVRWQGIVGIVLGIFSLLLILLVGQFADPQPTSGTRRRNLRESQPTTKAYGGY